MAEETIAIIRGSGNVFADLDLPDADELLVKADLVTHIGGLIAERALTKRAAAQVLGISPSKVTALLRGELDAFPMESLLRFLNALDRDVRIVVAPKSPERDHGAVTVVQVSA